MSGLRGLGSAARRASRRAPRLPAPLAALTGPVNRASDRSLLWVGVAGALALVDGRFGRRAALRGLLAGGLASALANGPVRMVADRRRPSPSPWMAHVPGLPSPPPSSFPSSHAAVAFAFAAGAGQELPVAAAPLVGLAGVVAYSRLHAGDHDPRDVVAGAVLGAGMGLATRRLWPVAPHEPAETRGALAHTTVDPTPEGRGLAVVVNAAAGSSDSCAEELRRELPEAVVLEVEEGDDLEVVLKEAASSGCAIGVAGGDGSVNAAAQLAAEQGKPLLVVPGGTLNHFAYALGVMAVADAIEAVQHGQAVTVDRSVIDGHTFVNTASIGSYVDLVDAREKLEDKIGKWPAVVVALWGVLRHSEPVQLEIDGERRRIWMMFIGNCRYSPAGFGPSWRERLDDGQLDIRTIDAGQPWSRARLLLSVLTGRLARCRAYEQRFVTRMAIRSVDGALRLARDGETFDGSCEFTIEKCDEPLRVYVPRR